MCSQESDKDKFLSVLVFRNQPIFVVADIEHDSAITYDICAFK